MQSAKYLGKPNKHCTPLYHTYPCHLEQLRKDRVTPVKANPQEDHMRREIKRWFKEKQQEVEVGWAGSFEYLSFLLCCFFFSFLLDTACFPGEPWWVFMLIRVVIFFLSFTSFTCVAFQRGSKSKTEHWGTGLFYSVLLHVRTYIDWGRWL